MPSARPLGVSFMPSVSFIYKLALSGHNETYLSLPTSDGIHASHELIALLGAGACLRKIVDQQVELVFGHIKLGHERIVHRELLWCCDRAAADGRR